MFVKESSKHQMKNTACIARAALFEPFFSAFSLLLPSETRDRIHPSVFPSWDADGKEDKAQS